MANFKNDLRSGYNRLRLLRDDLHATSFARRGWNDLVLARRTVGPDQRIEHGFLAEHFLVTWANWRGLLDRFCRYFGQSESSCPRTWAQLSNKCDVLAFVLARDRELDKAIAESWFMPQGRPEKLRSRHIHDVLSIYGQIVKSHERADALNRAEKTRPRFAEKKAALKKMVAGGDVLPASKRVVNEQNEALVEQWHGLPRGVQDQASTHLRHYLHSTLNVSWLVDPAPVASALLNIFWRKQPVSVTLKETVGALPSDPRTSEIVERLLDRLKSAIAEFGYEAVVDDLLSPETIGGEDDSLLPTPGVTVVPGPLVDTTRPILLAVTKGWNGKNPLSFCKVMRQVKARLTESRGSVKVVVVFCDSWDSDSFQEEQSEELGAHARNGVQFLFLMVGVPDRALVSVPVEFDQAR